MNRDQKMDYEEYSMSERRTQLTHYEMQLQGVQPRGHRATTLAWRCVKVGEEVAEVQAEWLRLEIMDGQKRMTQPAIQGVLTRMASELMDVMLCGMQATVTEDLVQDMFERMVVTPTAHTKYRTHTLGAFRRWMQADISALVLAQGTAMSTVIGYTGQNPRKGRTHQLHDVNMAFYRLTLRAWEMLGKITDDPCHEFAIKIAARRTASA